MSLDIKITGGSIYDGSGNPWYKADVGIKDGSIAAIGDLSGVQSDRSIDVAGMAVSPGFIDVHTHADLVLSGPRNGQILEPFIRQGITTLVTGNCGFGPAPVVDRCKAMLKSYLDPLMGAGDESWQWNSMAEFLDATERGGVCVNEAMLAPHGTARINVMGFEARAATPEETAQIARYMGQAVEEGAIGVTAGLWYLPGLFAETDELIEVAKAQRGKGYFGVHTRNYGSNFIPAMEEGIEVGKAAGVPVHLAHFTAGGQKNWHLVEEGLEIVDRERAQGFDVTLDLFPYQGGNTFFTAIYPPWALAGGPKQLAERLSDPPTRKKIRMYIEKGRPAWPAWVLGVWQDNVVGNVGWGNIRIAWTPVAEKKWMEGKTVQQIADQMGSDPFDVAADLTISDGGGTIQFIMGLSGSGDDNDMAMREAMKHPAAMFETDALITGSGAVHPAGYGTFPRYLGHYVRELGVMTLEEAIRKSTSASANRAGMKGRGLIKEGMAADVTIFNAGTIIDRATWDEPAQFPEGIEYVLINGKVVLDQGKYDAKAAAGKVLRNRGNGVY